MKKVFSKEQHRMLLGHVESMLASARGLLCVALQHVASVADEGAEVLRTNGDHAEDTI